MYRLQIIIKENLYCEDGKIHIKNKLKYDVVNLVEELDKKFIKELYVKLECND